MESIKQFITKKLCLPIVAREVPPAVFPAEGYSTVVDLDLEKFFDEVNHTRLIARLARDIKDRRVLRLVVKFLKAGLMQDGVCARRAPHMHFLALRLGVRFDLDGIHGLTPKIPFRTTGLWLAP